MSYMIGDKVGFCGDNGALRDKVGGAMGEIYSKVLNEDSFVVAYGKASYIIMAVDLERFRGQVKSDNDNKPHPDHKKEKKDKNGPQISRRRGKPEPEEETDTNE